jgi:hypothetical protein
MVDIHPGCFTGFHQDKSETYLPRKRLNSQRNTPQGLRLPVPAEPEPEDPIEDQL